MANRTERKAIADKILAAMEEKKMQPSDLNEAIGVARTNTAIYSWINGSTMPNAASRVKLRDALGISFDTQARMSPSKRYTMNQLLSMLRVEAHRMGITSMTFTIGDNDATE